MALTNEDLLEMYRLLVLIRKFEEATIELIKQGKYGILHPSIGQEAIAVGTCYGLRREDLVMPSHRGRGLFLVKGVSARDMMAAMFCRRNAPGKGLVPDHHIGDLHLGILAGVGLLGTGIPVAVGAALASKMKGQGNVTLCYFGDGTSNRGDVHEGMNMAAALKLPVVFICENNQYAVTTPVTASTGCACIADRAVAYGFPGVRVDGNDVLAVHQATQVAAERARGGEGPTLIEAVTYRWTPHTAMEQEHRSKEEIEEWKQKDPIKRFEGVLAVRGVAMSELSPRIHAEVARELRDAINYAEQSPQPCPDDLFHGVFYGREVSR